MAFWRLHDLGGAGETKVIQVGGVEYAPKVEDRDVSASQSAPVTLREESRASGNNDLPASKKTAANPVEGITTENTTGRQNVSGAQPASQGRERICGLAEGFSGWIPRLK